MREEYYSLSSLWGGGDVSLRRKPVRDVFGHVSGCPKLGDILLRDGGGHPLASRSGHGAAGPTKKVRTWALGLESARTDEQRRKKAWVKTGDPYPFIKTVKKCAPPHFPIKITHFPSATTDGTVGLPIPVLMRIPQ